MRKWIPLSLIALAIAAWFFWPQPAVDFQKITDNQVEQDWLVHLKRVDAIAFLDGGGRYTDLDPQKNLGMDQKVVRPIVERLKTEAKLEVIALIDQTPNQAFAIVARLPQDREQLLLVKRIMKEADDAFPGTILRQYGYQWMHFYVLDAEMAKSLHAEEMNEE